jgi:hypothetical protein
MSTPSNVERNPFPVSIPKVELHDLLSSRPTHIFPPLLLLILPLLFLQYNRSISPIPLLSIYPRRETSPHQQQTLPSTPQSIADRTSLTPSEPNPSDPALNTKGNPRPAFLSSHNLLDTSNHHVFTASATILLGPGIMPRLGPCSMDGCKYLRSSE